MKTKKNDNKMKNIPESVHENDDQISTPKSRKKQLKATVVTSAISLALLGAGQIPMQALLGGAEPPVLAQVSSKNKDDRALNEYFRQNFNYVDAKVLAGYWGGNTDQAKIRMGHKLLNLTQKEALSYIREARGVALERTTVHSQPGLGYLAFPIDYRDGGYQYDDAEVLSKYWKQDISETKLLMETMLVSGKDKDIQTALNNAKR